MVELPICSPCVIGEHDDSRSSLAAYSCVGLCRWSFGGGRLCRERRSAPRAGLRDRDSRRPTPGRWCIQFNPAGGKTGPSTSGGSPVKKTASSLSPATTDWFPATTTLPSTRAVHVQRCRYPRRVRLRGQAAGHMIKVGRELIPAQYNANSTLTAEIKQGGGNNLEFKLLSSKSVAVVRNRFRLGSVGVSRRNASTLSSGQSAIHP